MPLRGDFASLEVLVGGAIVPLGQRRALAGLAFPRRRLAARHPPVEGTGFDLLLDERRSGGDALLHGPRHLGLRRDGEVAPDVLEERAVRLLAVGGVLSEPL